jgi:hypothetical protein
MYFGRLPRILSCIFKIQVLQDRGTPRGKIGFTLEAIGTRIHPAP